MKFDAINYPNGKIEIPPFIEEEGTFDVILIEKMWGKRTNLICVFQKEDGTMFSTTAWRRRFDNHSEHYSPRKTDIEFADELKRTMWRCSFQYSSNGKYINWMTAEPLLG